MNELVAYQNTEVERKVIEEITMLYDDIQRAYETTFQKALRLGELLVAVKEHLPYGQFQDWIKNNLAFTIRAAQKYMIVFNNREILKQYCITNLANAFKLLADLRNEQRSLLEDEIHIVEIDESKELSELYAKIESLDNEKESLEDELSRKMDEISRLKIELNDEIRLKRDKKVIIEAMEKINSHTDPEKSHRDFSDLTETLKIIKASKSFFRKQTIKLQAMDLDPSSVKILREDLTNLLNIIDNWGVVVSKKFNIKLK